MDAAEAASHSAAIALQLVLPGQVGVIALETSRTAPLVRIRRLIRAADTTAAGPDILVSLGPGGLTVICAPQQVQRTATLLGAERISSTKVRPTAEVLESNVLKDAVEHWLAYRLHTREGYLPLTGGLLVDMQSAEADAPCSEKLRTAAAFKLSLRFGSQTRATGGSVTVDVTMSLLFQGRCWKSRDAISRLLGADPALAAELRDHGLVDLAGDRWWPRYVDPERQCDRTNEVSLLPDHAPATILQLSLDPPSSWPGDGGAVDPQHRKTGAEYVAELGEQLGIWVDSTDQLGHFCSVRMDLDAPPNELFDDGRACTWRIVPAATVWPSAGMRVVRRASQLPTTAALTRLLSWLAKQTPLGLGALKLVGSTSPPTAGLTTGAPARPAAVVEAGGTASAAAIVRSALERGVESEPIRTRPGVAPHLSLNDEGDVESGRTPRPSAVSHVLKRVGPPLRGISNQVPVPRTPAMLPPCTVASSADASCTPLGMSLGSSSAGGSAARTPTASTSHSFQKRPPARPFNEAPARPSAIKKPAPKVPKPPKPAASSAAGKATAASALEGVSLITDLQSLAAMKVPELKQQCALRKLKVSGTRAQLLERLGVGAQGEKGA
jgi:hypothetical protein